MRRSAKNHKVGPDYEKALRLTAGRAYYLWSKALRKLERVPEAKRNLDRSIALDPLPSPFYELAVLLRKSGDNAGSKRMFERVQALSKRPP